MREKELADDWVWIIDHTIQFGEDKVFCIVGVRLSVLQSRSYHLTAEDVEPLALLPVKKSNGEVVYQQLEAATAKTGIPRLIVGDHGSDVKKGVDLFCEQHEETSYIHDIKHKIALLLKKVLEADSHWQEFCQHATAAKLLLTNTALAFVAPPQQRAKSRYMNLEVLIHWAEYALHFLDNHREQGREDFNKNRLIQKLGWLATFRAKLKLWRELFDITSIVEDEVKQRGYSQETPVILRSALKSSATSVTGKKLAEQLLDFVSEQALKVKEGEQLLGSSDIIESAFGKLKQLERNQEKSGFTALILGLAALLAPTTPEVINASLRSVPTQCVIQWKNENLPRSVQAKRKEAISQYRNDQEQIQDQLLLAA